MNFMGLILVAGGIFSIVCAALDFEWFMNHPKAKFMSSILSRNGARAFYIVLGLLLVVLGALITSGVIENADAAM